MEKTSKTIYIDSDLKTELRTRGINASKLINELLHTHLKIEKKITNLTELEEELNTLLLQKLKDEKKATTIQTEINQIKMIQHSEEEKIRKGRKRQERALMRQMLAARARGQLRGPSK